MTTQGTFTPTSNEDSNSITTVINTNEDLTTQIIGLRCPICMKEAHQSLLDGEIDQDEYEDIIEESELVFVGDRLVCNLPETYHQLRVKITLEVLEESK